jgi:hypothetical protein
MSSMIGVALILVMCILIVIVACEARRRADFNKRFPPITDDEFLAACPPGTDPVIALRVREIVSEQLGVEYARLHPAMRFVEDLGA